MRRTTLIAIAFLALALVSCRDAPAPLARVDSLKIVVRETGLYRVPFADLQRQGLPADAMESGQISLTQAGEATPFFVDGDALLFYGLAPADRYTPERNYIVTAGQAGRTMRSEASGQTEGTALKSVRRTVRLEENWEYVSEAASTDDGIEPWFWQTIGFGQNAPIQFELDSVEDNAAARLQVRLYGASHNPAQDPDHQLALSVNQAPGIEISWDGQQFYTATVELPPGALVAGSNSLVIESRSDGFIDISKLDWFAIEYESAPHTSSNSLAFSSEAGVVALEGFAERPQLLDVTAPDAPVRLEGWQYEAGTARASLGRAGQYVAVADGGFLEAEAIIPLRTSELTNKDQQIDLIIITTGELAPALDDLVAAREAQGLRVAVVIDEEIYDTFGYGAKTPDSIRRFVQYAYEEWQAPTPRYLLLVGDASVDFKGYLATHPQNPLPPPEQLIPTYLVPVSFGGETVSDVRLADVEGDVRPELAVGRWPVASVAQVRDLVKRTLAYEGSSQAARTIFAVDASSSEFARLTEAIIEESGMPRNSSALHPGASADELAASLAEGAWLMTYVGHGSLQLWSKDGMLAAGGVGGLFLGEPSPIVVQLTCLTGLFAHPEISSLSELMLRDSNGPPLVIGATSLTLSVDQGPFAIELFQALQSAEVERIGDALQQAKLGLEVDRLGLREISDTFLLLGDPSAPIVRPTPSG